MTDTAANATAKPHSSHWGAFTGQWVNDKLVVTIEDRGLAPMPVRLAVTRSDGHVELMEVPVTVWLGGARSTTLTIANGATVSKLEIDPENVFPDIDRSNNRWTRAQP